MKIDVGKKNTYINKINLKKLIKLAPRRGTPSTQSPNACISRHSTLINI